MVTKSSFRTEFGLILVGAVIFTASFLWKDFLSDVEEKYFPKKRGLGGRFLFVVIVTIMLVAIAVYLRDLFKLSKSTSMLGIRFDDEPKDERVDEQSIEPELDVHSTE